MNHNPEKILVVRNDKLGDFMLAWPALSLLKQQFPDTEIAMLIPEYTSSMAKQCPWIDTIIIDDQRISNLSDALHLSHLIKAHNFDASITLFSEFRVALALWLARIPVRVSPATKPWQFLYNYRLTQRRSRSEKPEYMYNVDLVRYFIAQQNDSAGELPPPPYLKFDHKEIDNIKSKFYSRHGLPNTAKTVFVHAGSGGSANNLSLEQYASLIKYLSSNLDIFFVLTAGPQELDYASKLSELIHGTNHVIFHSTYGLVDFSKHIAFCDLFISGSTGPLHIAGALNKRTVAFYPVRRSATSLRWQTLNDDNKRLAFSPESNPGNYEMNTIDMKDCAEDILNRLMV